MKRNAYHKKLQLNKVTISNLKSGDMNKIRGGKNSVKVSCKTMIYTVCLTNCGMECEQTI
jgi:hypothetical protein